MRQTEKLVIGGGYLGARVARRWLGEGHRVYLMTRSSTRAEQLAEQGFAPILADVLEPSTLRNLPNVTTVLYAVARDRHAPYSMQTLYVDGLGHVLDALQGASPAKFVYISSTGVYGQTDGGWVDEASPCEPLRAGGVACWQAEQRLQSHPLGQTAIILRLAGIYGPDRVPMLDSLRRGLPIPADPHALLNLVHVDDAAEVVVQADRRAKPPRVYLVSDGHPVRREAYFAYLADLLDLPPPTYLPADEHSARAERGMSNKRVDSRRIREELGVRFAFPSYREGLGGMLAGGSRSLA